METTNPYNIDLVIVTSLPMFYWRKGKQLVLTQLILSFYLPYNVLLAKRETTHP